LSSSRITEEPIKPAPPVTKYFRISITYRIFQKGFAHKILINGLFLLINIKVIF
jgi:hypothetical protein